MTNAKFIVGPQLRIWRWQSVDCDAVGICHGSQKLRFTYPSLAFSLRMETSVPLLMHVSNVSSRVQFIHKERLFSSSAVHHGLRQKASRVDDRRYGPKVWPFDR